MAAVIYLNVGGKIFLTSRNTVEKSQGLKSIVDNPEHKTSEGHIFIDRDPTYFHVILNYLRDEKFSIDGYEQTQINELNAEAEFYDIGGLMFILKDKASKSKTMAELDSEFQKIRDMIQEEKARCDICVSEIHKKLVELTRKEAYEKRRAMLIFSEEWESYSAKLKIGQWLINNGHKEDPMKGRLEGILKSIIEKYQGQMDELNEEYPEFAPK